MAAAVAGRSTAQKVALVVGAGLTAGFGAYYVTQVHNRDISVQQQLHLSPLQAQDRSTAWGALQLAALTKSHSE
jgi:hypothetical protein